MKELISILADPYKEWAGDKEETYSKWAFPVLGIGIIISCFL